MSKPCPICKNHEAADKYRPFCSKRCADVDLNKWLTADYAIPAQEPPDDYEIGQEAAMDDEDPIN